MFRTPLKFLLSLALFSAWCVPAHAQFTESPLTNTNQIIAPDAQYPNVLAALNARYSLPAQGFTAAPNHVNGVLFQNFDWLGGAQGITGATSLTFAPSFADNTGRARAQNTAGTISGTNEAVLESIANSINFFGAGDSGTFTFSGLPANRNVRVQLIGGDDGGGFNNWNGDLALTANGNPVGTWNAGTDANNTDAKIATFTATTNGVGQLVLGVTQPVGGNHAGIAGAVILGAGPLSNQAESALTNTSQVGVARSGPGAVVAAGDLRFAGQAATPAGSVNGVSFTSVDFLGVGAQSLGNGVTVTVVGPAGDRSRSQNTATTISGAGDTIIEGVSNTINFLGGQETLTLNIAGLRPNQPYDIQLFGGDDGTNFDNWRGDLAATVNGVPFGLWNTGDDANTSATLLQISGFANGSGLLQVSLQNTSLAVGGPQFAGIGGFALIQTPEPGVIAVWSIVGLGVLLGAGKLRRKSRVLGG